MEKQQHTNDGLPTARLQEASAAVWVAPLQSIKIFSIAEFTQYEGNPGSDGTPTALS